MGYRNAKDIFPPDLLEQLWQYAEGECIYIPRRTPRPHPHSSAIARRNADIRRKRGSGTTVRQLAGEYYLSPQAIYKILQEK